MVRLNSREYDENKGASSSSLRLNDVDTKNLQSLTNQELGDLVMQFADYTEKGGSDVDMEKLNAIREELKRRGDEELKQYGEIRATIKNSHNENIEKANTLKSLLNENDDVIAKNFPELVSKEGTQNVTDKNDLNKGLKTKSSLTERKDQFSRKILNRYIDGDIIDLNYREGKGPLSEQWLKEEGGYRKVENGKATEQFVTEQEMVIKMRDVKSTYKSETVLIGNTEMFGKKDLNAGLGTRSRLSTEIKDADSQVTDKNIESGEKINEDFKKICNKFKEIAQEHKSEIQQLKENNPRAFSGEFSKDAIYHWHGFKLFNFFKDFCSEYSNDIYDDKDKNNNKLIKDLGLSDSFNDIYRRCIFLSDRYDNNTIDGEEYYEEIHKIFENLQDTISNSVWPNFYPDKYKSISYPPLSTD